jgi:hypothetical protein
MFITKIDNYLLKIRYALLELVIVDNHIKDTVHTGI